MKSLFIIATMTLSISTSSMAAQTFRITLDGSGGEIRHGSFLGNAVFSSFESELEVKLARLGVGLTNSRYTDATVSYDYKFNPNTFYSFKHKAVMTGSILLKDKNIELPYKLSCSALVQDGGNQTLKMSCVNKLAKTIKKLLKNNINL